MITDVGIDTEQSFSRLNVVSKFNEKNIGTRNNFSQTNVKSVPEEAGQTPRDPVSRFGGTMEQPRSGCWHALCERCRGVVQRASVSSAKPEAIDTGGRLERDVRFRGA